MQYKFKIKPNLIVREAKETLFSKAKGQQNKSWAY